MRQQKFEAALNEIARETSGDWYSLGEQHPNGVRPLDKDEQIRIMRKTLNRVGALAREALARDS